jgi:transcriptional antiterminator RfaH
MKHLKTQKIKPNINELKYFWYALYTKSRQEKKVYAEMEKCGLTAYLPLETKIRQWSDRKKKVEEPMIRSYVFVKSSEKEYYDILNISGAVRYVTFEGKAASIPEWQIDAMRTLLDHSLPHHYSEEQFLKGEQIKITEGPLKGYEGEVVNDSKGKQKLIIRIANIGYSMVIESPLVFVKKKVNSDG